MLLLPLPFPLSLKASWSDDMLQALSEANLLYGTMSPYLILGDLGNKK